MEHEVFDRSHLSVCDNIQENVQRYVYNTKSSYYIIYYELLITLTFTLKASSLCQNMLQVVTSLLVLPQMFPTGQMCWLLIHREGVLRTVVLNLLCHVFFVEVATSMISMIDFLRENIERMAHQKRCFICLKVGHICMDCPSSLLKSCYYCGTSNFHNRCICPKKFGTSDVNVMVPELPVNNKEESVKPSNSD